MRTEAKTFLDKMGITVTSLCALHCISMPFLLPLLPLLGLSFVGNEAFEMSLFTITIALGFSALSAGYFRYHQRLYPLIFLMIGFVIYLAKLWVGMENEPVFVVLSASFIVTSHVLNMKLTQTHSNCESHP